MSPRDSKDRRLTAWWGLGEKPASPLPLNYIGLGSAVSYTQRRPRWRLSTDTRWVMCLYKWPRTLHSCRWSLYEWQTTC